MTKDRGDNPQSTYVVAARARASAIFYPGEELGVGYREDDGSTRLVFTTRFRSLGFEVPVPEDLWVHAVGEATTINRAIERATTGARDIATALGLTANAWMGQIEPELAYDATQGITQRDFWQRLLPEEKLTLVPSRRIGIGPTRAVLEGLENSPFRDRLRRACSQYHSSLERWVPGSEVLAVAHLFMAIEALKPVAVDQECKKSGLSKAELAQSWGFSSSGRRSLDDFLQSEARRRVLFAGDTECHQRAKRVSDSFEHGFANSGALFQDARAVADLAAAYVRTFILDSLSLDQTTLQSLREKPYCNPSGPLDLLFCFRGTLEGENDTLAAPGNFYPIMEWKHGLEHVGRLPDGGYGFRPSNKLTARFAQGISMRAKRFEIWGNRTTTFSGDPPNIVVTPPEDKNLEGQT